MLVYQRVNHEHFAMIFHVSSVGLATRFVDFVGHKMLRFFLHGHRRQAIDAWRFWLINLDLNCALFEMGSLDLSSFGKVTLGSFDAIIDAHPRMIFSELDFETTGHGVLHES